MVSPLNVAPVHLPTVKTLPMINEDVEVAAPEEAEVKQEVAGKKERGIESQVVSEDNACDVDEKSIEARDEEVRGDTSGEVDDEDESEDGDDENLESAAQPMVQGIPASRRS